MLVLFCDVELFDEKTFNPEHIKTVVQCGAVADVQLVEGVVKFSMITFDG